MTNKNIGYTMVIMIKANKLLRDLILFLLFLILLKTAIDRNFSNVKKNKQPFFEPFEIHELDQNFLHSIAETKKQIDQMIDVAKNKGAAEALNQLIQIKKDAEQLEKKYRKNSPATFLLGPIGYSYIALKETKIEKELLKIINKTKLILHSFGKNGHKYEENNIYRTRITAK